uniref:UBA domain-containing protein n=1 Tax=Parastrongyloides trichosuri TaxID=131310 RepID=A0A0N4Z140_PARTI
MNKIEKSISFVEELTFFRGAPISKLWFFLFVSLTIFRVYWNATLDWTYTLRLSDFWQNTSLGQIILFILSVNDFTVTIGQIGLIHSGRLVERRFGSRKFFTFFLLIILISCPLFIYTLRCYTSFYRYNEHKIYIETLSEPLFAAIFVQLIKEIPILPYARIFGFPLSVHHFPIIFILQILISSNYSFIAIFIGAFISYLFSSNLFQNVFNKIIIPSKIFECDFTNLVYEFWDTCFNKYFEPADEALPIACTVEKQREELLDMYENEIIQQQMRQMYNNQHRNNFNNPDEQLHYLNRLLRRDNPMNVEQPTPEPPATAIETLRDMGFTNEDEVKEALRRFRNDVARAANHLLNR